MESPIKEDRNINFTAKEMLILICKEKNCQKIAEMFKTGGGIPKIQELISAEEMLLSILPLTIQGLLSIFVSDETFGIYVSRMFHLIYIILYSMLIL